MAEGASSDEQALALELKDLQFLDPDLDLTVSGLGHAQIDLKVAGLESVELVRPRPARQSRCGRTEYDPS
jgi:hypothetical protein